MTTLELTHEQPHSTIDSYLDGAARTHPGNSETCLGMNGLREVASWALQKANVAIDWALCTAPAEQPTYGDGSNIILGEE